jgi:hypothetical protein
MQTVVHRAITTENPVKELPSPATTKAPFDVVSVGNTLLLLRMPSVFGRNLQCELVRKVNTPEECHWPHAISLGASRRGTNGILECKFLSKTRTVPLVRLWLPLLGPETMQLAPECVHRFSSQYALCGSSFITPINVKPLQFRSAMQPVQHASSVDPPIATLSQHPCSDVDVQLGLQRSTSETLVQL